MLYLLKIGSLTVLEAPLATSLISLEIPAGFLSGVVFFGDEINLTSVGGVVLSLLGVFGIAVEKFALKKLPEEIKPFF